MKKYQVVCYMRIDPRNDDPKNLKEAKKEKKHWELLHPENIYKIEECIP